jgi:hypothetical protein
VVVRVGEGVPHPAGGEDQGAGGRRFGVRPALGHGQRTVEDVDRFVEPVVDVRGRAGEVRGHGELAEREAVALPEHTDDVAGVGDPPGRAALARVHEPQRSPAVKQLSDLTDRRTRR